MNTPLSCVEISKKNLIHNIQTFRNLIPKKTKLVAVVKANAYGHGLKEIVTIAEAYVDYFQVDDIEELRDVRRYSQKPVLVFGYVQSSDLEEAVALDGTLGVYSKETLAKLNAIGEKYSKKITIHLKIDALLGRQGILVDEVKEYGILIQTLPYIHLEAIYSHFSNIEDSHNLEHAHAQHAQLLEAKQILQTLGFQKITSHISATSGLLADVKGNWGSSLLRLGIGMYGEWPSKYQQDKFLDHLHIRPVLRWISHLAQVKIIPKGYPVGYGCTFVSKHPMTIGVVPQGYSDGYDRGFSNNGCVLVQGNRCPILGRVAMNMFVVDLTAVPDAKAEDEVVLLGMQGNLAITAESQGCCINTISYEILARISPLLHRTIV